MCECDGHRRRGPKRDRLRFVSSPTLPHTLPHSYGWCGVLVVVVAVCVCVLFFFCFFFVFPFSFPVALTGLWAGHSGAVDRRETVGIRPPACPTNETPNHTHKTTKRNTDKTKGKGIHMVEGGRGVYTRWILESLSRLGRVERERPKKDKSPPKQHNTTNNTKQKKEGPTEHAKTICVSCVGVMVWTMFQFSVFGFRCLVENVAHVDACNGKANGWKSYAFCAFV